MKKTKLSIPKIVIIGHSGAGKTTTSNKMADILDCPAIHGDEIMFDAVGRFPEKTIKVFGEDPHGDGQAFFSRYFKDHTTIRNERALPRMTKDYVSEQVYGIIEAMANGSMDNFFLENAKAVYNPKQKPDSVIFEWHAAPLTNHWSEALYRILVKSDTETRRRMLMARMREEGITKEDVPLLRYLAIEPEYQRVKSEIDFIIRNNYGENLSSETKKLCKVIERNS